MLEQIETLHQLIPILISGFMMTLKAQTQDTGKIIGLLILIMHRSPQICILPLNGKDIIIHLQRMPQQT